MTIQKWGMDMSAVYMLASRRHGTLYIGVTSDLVRRITQHRDGTHPGFTARYSLKRLVWFERHDGIVSAIRRETRLKKYPRDWKINLIERETPYWQDLYPGLLIERGPLSHLQPIATAM
jgi:putative endonuclease